MKGFKLGAQIPQGLIKAGQKLGFKYGGTVKGGDTSGEFKMKTGPMADMDDGVQPKRKGRTQQEIEAGGTPKLKPEFQEGGYVPPEKNPYKKGTARYNMWERKYGKGAKKKGEGKKKKEETDAGIVKKGEKLKGKSAKWLEEHGIKKGGRMKKYAEGGEVEGEKKGGLAHASKYKHGGPYKSEPMFGKK